VQDASFLIVGERQRQRLKKMDRSTPKLDWFRWRRTGREGAHILDVNATCRARRSECTNWLALVPASTALMFVPQWKMDRAATAGGKSVADDYEDGGRALRK
jgi:hypothetical protein